MIFPDAAESTATFRWNWHHFDGVDWDETKRKNAIYQFTGKEWDSEVDGENGNYDYLMGADALCGQIGGP